LDKSLIVITGKPAKCSNKPSGVFAEKEAILPESSQTKLVYYSETRRHIWQMETVFQISFKPGHLHAILPIKIWKGGRFAGCDKGRSQVVIKSTKHA